MKQRTWLVSTANEKWLTLLLAIVLVISFGVLPASAELKFYGYFSINYEDVAELPDGENDPGEFTLPHFNVMFQSRLSDKFRVYANLAGDGAETVEVRNYWGEYTINQYLKFRAGKIYRPFGLFNEKLDAVPTYLGIEPPELFDKDHLMLPRTGLLMATGNIALSRNRLTYSVMTGNNEVVDTNKPISWDLHYDIGNSTTIGTSGYRAAEIGSPIGVGEGSPPGGILPWMEEDTYTVVGAYFETRYKNWMFKTAYWTADHDAIRDPYSVASLYDAGLNSNQLTRFGLDTYDPSTPGDVSMIDTDGSYKVNTYYVRLGYSIAPNTIGNISWEIVPFAFWDFYENEETIASKHYGGDNEAGLADDGKFSKPTIGIVFRPSGNVAFKIDASSHMYKWTDPADPGAGSSDVSYGEIRFDVSYFFQ